MGKGGKEVWIEGSYNPLCDRSGKPYKVIKFATDLSSRKAENRRLADQFETGVKALVGTVTATAGETQKTARSLVTEAGETDQQSLMVSAAAEELSAAINEIARQLTQATGVVNVAVAEAAKSNQMVAELVQVSEKIIEVTDLISRIAAQTNLLALNATIEAARAGEAGASATSSSTRRAST